MSNPKIAFVFVVAWMCWAPNSQAQSLNEALSAALQNSPTVSGAQASVALAYEQRAGAGAAGRMRIQAEGTAAARRQQADSLNFLNRQVEQERSSQTNSVGVSVSQPIYTGGRLTASLALSQSRITAAELSLAASELQAMRSAAGAYAELVRAEAVYEIFRSSLGNLGTDLAGANARFRAGEVSLTDVAQSESRLASVQGQMARALGDLESARAVFERFIGAPPQNIDRSLPQPLTPALLVDYIDLAMDGNFELQLARARFETAQATVRSAATARNPSATLDAGYQSRWNEAFAGSRAETTQVTARVIVPLWDGGATSASVRQAIAQASIARSQVTDIEREVRSNATRAWSNFTAAQAVVIAAERQVSAAEVARRGALAELRFGLRSTIEALNQEVELRQALTNLAGAKRDVYVARIELLALMGLTPLGKLPRSINQTERSAIPPPALPRLLPIERPIYSVLEFLEANDKPVAQASRSVNQMLEPNQQMGPMP